jgi:hypothetical protein
MKIKANILFLLLLYIMISLSSLGQMKVLYVPGVNAPSGYNWCWAVVTTEVSNYYGNNRQICEIVESARVNFNSHPHKNRGSVNCCYVPCPDSCKGGNSGSIIEPLLGLEGIQASRNTSQIPLSSVVSSIEDNRPMIAHATKRKGPTGNLISGHVMVVTGYNGGDIHYNDGGLSYIIPYDSAISGENMGIHYWKWTDGATLMLSAPCPKDLGIIENIIESRDIKAKESITISSQIGNNITVNLKAGSSIILDKNFYIPVGSILLAEISSNPCQ